MTKPTSTDSESQPPREEKPEAPIVRPEAGAELKLVGKSPRVPDPAAPRPSRTGSPTDSRTGPQVMGRAAGESQEPAERRGLPIWLFLLVLVLFSVALFWQVRVARDLAAEVAGLEQELLATQARLGAHRSHLGEIRSGVHDLADRLAGLQALVDAEPGETRAQARGVAPKADGVPTPPGDDPRPIPSRLPQR